MQETETGRRDMAWNTKGWKEQGIRQAGGEDEKGQAGSERPEVAEDEK
jgi:hypothetical protein